MHQPRATKMLLDTQQPTEPPITASPTDVAGGTEGGVRGVSELLAV